MSAYRDIFLHDASGDHPDHYKTSLRYTDDFHLKKKLSRGKKNKARVYRRPASSERVLRRQAKQEAEYLDKFDEVHVNCPPEGACQASKRKNGITCVAERLCNKHYELVHQGKGRKPRSVDVSVFPQGLQKKPRWNTMLDEPKSSRLERRVKYVSEKLRNRGGGGYIYF